MYRALKTTSERKAAFEAYIDREAKREKVCRHIPFTFKSVASVSYKMWIM